MCVIKEQQRTFKKGIGTASIGLGVVVGQVLSLCCRPVRIHTHSRVVCVSWLLVGYVMLCLVRRVLTLLLPRGDDSGTKAKTKGSLLAVRTRMDLALISLLYKSQQFRNLDHRNR